MGASHDADAEMHSFAHLTWLNPFIVNELTLMLNTVFPKHGISDLAVWRPNFGFWKPEVEQYAQPASTNASVTN